MNYISSHKKVSFVVAVIIFIAILFFFFSPKPIHDSDERKDMNKVEVKIGGKSVIAWVADNEILRSRGLSGVSNLSDSKGMLFYFDEPGIYGFWMKDMIIPIDIIWFNSSLETVYIEKGVATSTYPSIFFPKRPAKFALEVASGTASILGLKIGDKISTTTIK
jgi:uncharacterized membrane protein (UPF0127 family)